MLTLTNKFNTKKSIFTLSKLVLLTLGVSPLFNSALAQPVTITTTPTIIDDVLTNPDIGITEHQSFDTKNDPWWNEPTYPETSVVYFRWYWEELEPIKGVYNFKLIDETINKAAALGKKTVIRFMTMAGKDETYYRPSPNAGKKILGIPCWLKKQIDPNTSNTCTNNNDYTVNYKNPVLKHHLNRFLQAMGKRYNNNPNLLRLDVGLVGSWGEWNLATRKTKATMGQNGYKDKDLLPYPNMLETAFPNKTLTMLVSSSDENVLGHTTKKGYGWRADCLGDWTGKWNHMDASYPDTIKHILGMGNKFNPLADKDFLSRWKKAPVDFEICYMMTDWAARPHIYTKNKVKQTFDAALDMHASLLNLKSGKIPKMYQPLLQDFLKKLGYRFELNEVKLTSSFKKGQFMTIDSTWSNSGVAPSYNNYPVVWRLRDKHDNVVKHFKTNNDIRSWLPADNKEDAAPEYKQKNTFIIPKYIKSGQYYLDVALVKPYTNEAQVKLGIEGQRNDKWHQVESIYINQ